MNLYPIVTTPALRECREFYVKAFDARVVFESEWYVQLALGDWEFGFLRPNPPKRLPVFQHATVSRGLCYAVEVGDVRAVHADLVQRGFEPLGQPEEFPNGEIAFSIVDPSGVVLNVVEHRSAPSKVIEL